MKNGVELYDAKPGKGKGTHRVRLRASGKIIATSGEGYMNKSQCDTWPLRVCKELLKREDCCRWAAKKMFGIIYHG